jgi:4-hydroxy-2-oxoheptanedioate aldolase
MIANRIIDRIRKGEKALGLHMSNPSEELVELAGRMGLDFVAFDGQHSPLTPERVGTLCRIADGFGVTPTMRVPDHRESTLLSYLDKGIRLLIVPNLQTREEAENLVKYTYFAPLGLRSATSIRTALNQGKGGRKELFEQINAHTLLVPQLESATALKNVDEILKVNGIDFFAAGFEDLAQSMGLPGQANHPEVQGAYAKAVEKVKAAGKHLYNDWVESIDVFGLVRGSLEALLEKHGRRSLLF